MTQKEKLKKIIVELKEKKVTHIHLIDLKKLLANYYETKEKTLNEYIKELVMFDLIESTGNNIFRIK